MPSEPAIITGRYAVTGRAYSGKSTFCRALRSRFGVPHESYTDFLKELASDAINYLGRRVRAPRVTVTDILRDKDAYRTYLIALSQVIHFDDPQWVNEFLCDIAVRHRVPGSAGPEGSLPETFTWDNVRYGEQFTALDAHGFVLVRLSVSDAVQEQRAAREGVVKTPAAWDKLRSDPTEQPLAPQAREIVLTEDAPLDALVEEFVAKATLMQDWLASPTLARAIAEGHPIRITGTHRLPRREEAGGGAGLDPNAPGHFPAGQRPRAA